MDQMIRKQIYLGKHQTLRLERRAKLYGISQSELVRRALDGELNQSRSRHKRRDPEAWVRAHQRMLDLQAQGPLPNAQRNWTRQDFMTSKGI